MMKTGVTFALGLLLLAPGVSAQDDLAIVMGQYFRCSQGLEAQADEVVQEVFGPVIQQHVDAGNLTGWLWLTHVQGGAWRRLLATTGNDLGQMMQAREEIVAELTEEHADQMTELGTACPGHDDYVLPCRSSVRSASLTPITCGPTRPRTTSVAQLLA